MARPPALLGPRLRRVLAMLPWLLERGTVGVREVAERFGLAEEEVVRDLALVGAFGVDDRVGLDRLEVDLWDDDPSGEAVVHAFAGAMLTEAPRLTDAHSFAVLTAGRALLAVPGSDQGGSLARALRKLESALGGDVPLEVDLERPAHLDALRAAVDRRERLQVGYWAQYRDAVTDRRIDPLGVYSLRGRWYVLARDERSGEERRFRVDRIRSVVPTGETFEHEPVELPADAFEPPPGAPLVRLVVPPEGRWVLESYDPIQAEELADGRVEVSFHLVGERWLERLLLRLGPDARVEDPPELRDLQRRAAERLLRRYA
jgi:proteasome accessory factor C